MRRLDIVDQLGRVDSPTLVSVGELDPVTPVAAAEEIVRGLPEDVAKLEVIEGAGSLGDLYGRRKVFGRRNPVAGSLFPPKRHQPGDVRF